MKPSSDDAGLSVDVRRLLDDPSNPATVLGELQEHGLVELRLGAVRQMVIDGRPLGIDAVHAPLPGRPAHGNITGLANPPDPVSAKRAQREIAKLARWVRNPASYGAGT